MASDMGKKPSAVVDPVAVFKARFAAASEEEKAAMIAELQAL